MARMYAGVLGPLAMFTTIADGLIDHRTCECVALTAWIALVVFAAIGGALGWIANRTVEESVRLAIAEHLAEDESGHAAL